MQTQTATVDAQRQVRRMRLSRGVNELGLLAAIIVLYIVLGTKAGGFLTSGNQLGILRDAAQIGIAAWGMTLVIIAGDIDISIGPAVAFGSVMVAKGATAWGLGVPLAVVLTLVIGSAIGAFAGFLRAQYNVPAFIATLGVYSALRGLAQFISNALPVPLPDSGFFDFLAGSVAGVPTPAVVMILLLVVFLVIALKTPYGRAVYALGGNPRAAELAGIAVKRIRISLFAVNGLLAAITGVLLAARLGSGNGGAAMGLEFDVIAAVVIGGTALAGGSGSILATALGVIFITLIGNGLVLLGVNQFLQDVVRGVIIVLAVLVNVLLGRRNRLTS
ncbi:sugar ABC transporter permease [Actinoallomurus iriomotensis]|uniref:Sugar ABC transporter permease n=2 Tax=Actinoallomurus iriomotensis TaxID=478107 RepID=A0A9W6VMS7_9ACTN|nr:sugar ABC transporter permease [Actinoallomurus iriomotensis]GLY82173.1 sugar ABC transporter permease [Actinoallomurus iriomotensis]